MLKITANILFIQTEIVICDFNSDIYTVICQFIGIFNFRRHQIIYADTDSDTVSRRF